MYGRTSLSLLLKVSDGFASLKHIITGDKCMKSAQTHVSTGTELLKNVSSSESLFI